MAGMIDTHAHLTHPDLADDLDGVLERAWAAGLEAVIAVGYDLASSRQAVEMAARHERIYASVGIHPHDADSADDAAFQELAGLAKQPKVVAIGETGLDFYRDLSARSAQVHSFRRHMELARECGLPLIVHDREAHQAVLEMLEASGLRQVILHCFSGSAEMAKRACALGFHIGIAGPVTFPSARKLPEVLRSIPCDNVVVETDCPWLAPAPHRGKRNEPAYLPLIVEAVAAVWGQSPERAAAILRRNSLALLSVAR